MIPIDFTKLIYSITYYLSYQDKIGRAFMVNESSLKYPVADFLTSMETPIANIQLEYSHPNLSNKRIDIVTTDKLKKEIECAYEFKIARENTKYESEQKRIFNDLMRLYLVNKLNGSCCYFIIVGTHKDYIQSFRSIPSSRPLSKSKDLPHPEGFYTEWFEFEPGKIKTINIKKQKNIAYQNIYSSFLKNYKAKVGKLELPDNFKTTCISISALSRDFPIPYAGGIWKIG